MHIQLFHKELYKNCRSICTQMNCIYRDIDKILIALKAKNAGKGINIKLRII